ncbi:MAG: ATP-binding protein [Limisphaerales bacterium]
MYRQPNNSIYRTVVVVWLTLSVASVLLAGATWRDLAATLHRSRAAVATRAELSGILQLLVDCETAQRGFTITGVDSFLNPLTAGEAGLPECFERLVELAKDDSDLLTGIMELRGQAEVVLSYHHRLVEVRREEGPGEAMKLVAEGEGRRLMDQVRLKITELAMMRRDPVFGDQTSGRAEVFRAGLTSLVAGILGVGAGVFALWLARVMLGHQQRERRLVEQRLEAERSSREKTAFLANMSHEIRTPMNAILGFGELLAGELSEPRHQRYVRAIQGSASGLLTLINDILDLSKIEAGVMDLRLEPTDPREICDFVQTLFSEAIAKKGLKLICAIDQDLPRALLLDRIRLRQVLVNLVGNAVKFTDTGTIEVRVSSESGTSGSEVTLLIEVIDTGVGIPADKLEAVFKPFVQAGTHKDKEVSGTGLGLSIVRRLTEIMGGTVTAASEVGKGSAFSLRFPEVDVSARLPVREKHDSDEACDFNVLRPATILVVDDNAANRDLLSGIFAETHHRVIVGTSGADAIAMAESERPDLILLDIRMPGIGGCEALPRIRALSGLELTPVIAVTASSLLREEEDLKARFDGYVRKPFSKRELFDEIAMFLPRQTAEAEEHVSSPPTVGTGRPAAAPPLIAELRRLLSGEWPGLRDGLAVNECRRFAERLQDLARQWESPALAGYAETLARHAENYAVVELEAQILGFPEVVRELEGTPTR